MKQDAVSRNGGPLEEDIGSKPAKKPKEKLPYVGDPTVQTITGQPDDCWEYVNRWGTYEVQSTQDTDNPYPSIAQGYPSGAVQNPSDPWRLNEKNG